MSGGTPKSGDRVPHGTFSSVFFQILRLAMIRAGDLAVWAGMYSVGVAVVLGAFLDRRIGVSGVVYVWLCAHGGYVLDRVKFRDRDFDPADLMADPRRHSFLRRHARVLRGIMVFEWVGAVVVGSMISPVLGVLVVGGVVAGYGYSGWRPAADGGRVRLKDVAGLKAGLVGCSVVGLGLAAVLGGELGQDLRLGIGATLGALGGVDWVAVVGVLVMVCGDAVICDLDDRESDQAYLTRSLPVLMGMRGAGLIAAGMLVVGGVILIAEGGDQVRMRAVFSGMMVVSGIGILRQGREFGGRRDWIDGRMLVVVMCAVLAG